ncbi:MAG: ABC transporter ATP-binding protein/permease [Chloroflexota bacterium]|nr:ABC transporter ATP-binding protein/permease [Chloroflexota bacterium]
MLVTYLAPQWRRVVLLALLVLTGIALKLINPQVIRYIIDTAIAGGALGTLTGAAILFIGIALLNQAIAIAATYLSENIAWLTTNQLRTDLVAHCLTLDIAFHKVHTSGELIERIDGDVDTLSTFFTTLIIHLLGNVILLIGILVLLFREDWRIGWATTAFALLALLILIRIRHYATRWWIAIRQKSADFYGFLGEQLGGTEDIRANGATSYVMSRFYAHLRSWLPLEYRANLAGYSMWITTLSVFAVGNAVAFALGAYLLSLGAITIGTVYLMFYYIDLLEQPMQQIRSQLVELQKAAASIQRVNELLHTRPAIEDTGTMDLPAGALSIEFDNLSFGYTNEHTVLYNLSFQLKPGHVLGVLGRTGSGKTTLARLLLRLYDYSSGGLCVGGIPIEKVSLRNLRQHIGMVTQDVQLFHASVRNNLTFFDCAISDDRIIKVLDDIGLSAWFRSLPNGLDTELGSDGNGLSAGEAQLLAFARVFLANPGLVILDEASSRLDPATEQLIERAVTKLLEGRTGIVIAHRLATIGRADEILLLQDGKMLEYGPRTELLRNPASQFARLLQTGLEEVHA